MKVIQAYNVSRAGGHLGHFLKKEDAEALRDNSNSEEPSRLAFYAARVDPCFLLEVEQNGVTMHFALQPVQVT
jgi:hypothetical protein